MGDTLLIEDRGPVRVLTLNRPEKLNAIDHPTVVALGEAIRAAEVDETVRVVVLTGAGRAFSAGYDLTEEATSELSSLPAWRQALAEDVAMTMTVWACAKPTVAAVRGYCIAGGLEVAIACDLVVATDDARFGEPEVRYGSGPVTLLLPHTVGPKAASWLLLTGDLVDAHAAKAMGLVNQVVPADGLDAAVEALARKLALVPPAVMAPTKLALRRALQAMGLLQAVEANLDLSAQLNAADTPEQREFDRVVREQGLKAALAWRDERFGERLW
jgi:enoyl-CoA hydratase